MRLLLSDGRYRDDGRDGESRKADHAGELGADLEMAQQLHHSPYGMVIIARVGSMKFLPIMNGRVRRLPRKRSSASPMRKHAGTSCDAGAWPVILAGGNRLGSLVATEFGWSGNEPIRSPHHHVRAARRGPRPDLERAGLALRWHRRKCAGAVPLFAGRSLSASAPRERAAGCAACPCPSRIGADRAAAGGREVEAGEAEQDRGGAAIEQRQEHRRLALETCGP